MFFKNRLNKAPVKGVLDLKYKEITRIDDITTIDNQAEK